MDCSLDDVAVWVCGSLDGVWLGIGESFAGSDEIRKENGTIRSLDELHDGLVGRLVYVAYGHGREVDARIGVVRRLDGNENGRRLPLAPGAHDEEHGRAEAEHEEPNPEEPARMSRRGENERGKQRAVAQHRSIEKQGGRCSPLRSPFVPARRAPRND